LSIPLIKTLGRQPICVQSWREAIAVQSELAMGEVVQRAGRLFLRLPENKLRSRK